VALFDAMIVFAAKYLFLLILAAAFVYWLVAPLPTKKYLLILGIIVGAASLGAGRLIAHFYFDPRPFVAGHFTPLIPHEPDNGFPSDHTLLSSAVAATVTACNPALGIALWVVTLIVGVARVLSGLHHAIDVAGSIVIAAAAAAIAHAALRHSSRRLRD
jgi:undecaprenyl-diphosphatase